MFFGKWRVKYILKNDSHCYVLTFGPSKMPFKVMHRKEVTHSNGSYVRKSRERKLADEMGRAKKFPWYTHKLMHRKRVTSELHDSYFRLMTIKHSISKIVWASNDYIIQLSSTSQWSCQLSCGQLAVEFGRGSSSRVGDGDRRYVVGKAISGGRGLWALMS